MNNNLKREYKETGNRQKQQHGNMLAQHNTKGQPMCAQKLWAKSKLDNQASR